MNNEQAAVFWDNFWKGLYGHNTADFITNYYGCPDPYAVTEMEEIAVANTAECFDIMHNLFDAGSIVIDAALNGEL